MTVVRWVFFDPSDSSSYTVPVNPNQMTSPFPDKNTELGVQSPVTGQYRISRLPTMPVEWSFGGRIYDAAHHDALLEWSKRPNLIEVTDHLGRTFSVLLKEFAPTERYPTALNYDRYEYEMNALSFGLI